MASLDGGMNSLRGMEEKDRPGRMELLKALNRNGWAKQMCRIIAEYWAEVKRLLEFSELRRLCSKPWFRAGYGRTSYRLDNITVEPLP